MSITSSTDICNLALDLLSAGTVQNIEDPTSPTEELLARWYDLCRKKCLREHPWNFATKRTVLAASSTTPAFGYANAFPVPSDFIRILYVSSDLLTDGEAILPQSSYQFENGSILITDTFGDSGVLNLVYTYDMTDVSRMDPMFIDLLSCEIASSVAFKVTENNSNIERIESLLKLKKAQARAIDGQERPPQRLEYSRALSARRNNSTLTPHRIVF